MNELQTFLKNEMFEYVNTSSMPEDIKEIFTHFINRKTYKLTDSLLIKFLKKYNNMSISNYSEIIQIIKDKKLLIIILDKIMSQEINKKHKNRFLSFDEDEVCFDSINFENHSLNTTRRIVFVKFNETCIALPKIYLKKQIPYATSYVCNKSNGRFDSNNVKTSFELFNMRLVSGLGDIYVLLDDIEKILKSKEKKFFTIQIPMEIPGLVSKNIYDDSFGSPLTSNRCQPTTKLSFFYRIFSENEFYEIISNPDIKLDEYVHDEYRGVSEVASYDEEDDEDDEDDEDYDEDYEEYDGNKRRTKRISSKSRTKRISSKRISSKRRTKRRTKRSYSRIFK